MKNKKGQSYSNIIILILIVLIAAIFGLGYKNFGADLLTSEHSNLDTQSQRYITNELYGLNISYEEKTAADKEQAPYLLKNETQSSKDYSLDFQQGKEQSESFWGVVFDIYNTPFIISTLLGVNKFIPDWLQGIISTFLWTVVTISIFYLLRGLK